MKQSTQPITPLMAGVLAVLWILERLQTTIYHNYCARTHQRKACVTYFYLDLAI
jgi:hypothetical protein